MQTRGRRHIVNIRVLVDDPHIQSPASLHLLKCFYRSCDIPKVYDPESRYWRRVWLTFRNKYMRRQKKLGNMICYICKKTKLNPNINSPTAKGKEATVDHVTPTSRGGKRFDEKNLRVCCKKCNQLKGDSVGGDL